MARTKIQPAPQTPSHMAGTKPPGRKPTKSIGYPRSHPAVSGKTPAHNFIHTGPSSGGHLGGKTYFPKAPKRLRRKRVIYTAPPLKGFKPAKRGAKALHEVAYFQGTTEFVIPRAPLDRLVRELAQGYGDYHFTPGAIIALRRYAEHTIVRLFQDAQRIALHAGRVTIRVTDIRLVLSLTGLGASLEMGERLREDLRP